MLQIAWLLIGIDMIAQLDQSTDSPESLAVHIARLGSSDDSVRQQAVKSIHAQLPTLEMLSEPLWLNSQQRIDVRRSASPFIRNLIPLLEDSETVVRHVAMTLLLYIGPDARAAVPTLIRLARNEHPMQGAATLSVLFIVPESQSVLKDLWPAWEQSLLAASDDNHPNTSNRMRATIIALQVPFFAAMLRNSGHTTSEVPTLVIVACQGKSTESRAFSIALLGEMGADAQSAVPTLRKLLKDSNLLVRRFAASSILQIDVDRRTTTRFRAEDMTSEDEFVELEGLITEEREKNEAQWRTAAASIGRESPYALAMLRFGSGAHRRRTLRMLADVGPVASFAVPELERLVHHSDPETRRLAYEALVRIAPERVSACTASDSTHSRRSYRLNRFRSWLVLKTKRRVA